MKDEEFLKFYSNLVEITPEEEVDFDSEFDADFDEWLNSDDDYENDND